jgi:hypothetical protein
MTLATEPFTMDVAALQLLPEEESATHGSHMLASCNLTCPWFTSDSVPSICCDAD